MIRTSTRQLLALFNIISFILRPSHYYIIIKHMGTPQMLISTSSISQSFKTWSKTYTHYLITAQWWFGLCSLLFIFSVVCGLRNVQVIFIDLFGTFRYFYSAKLRLNQRTFNNLQITSPAPWWSYWLLCLMLRNPCADNIVISTICLHSRLLDIDVLNPVSIMLLIKDTAKKFGISWVSSSSDRS